MRKCFFIICIILFSNIANAQNMKCRAVEAKVLEDSLSSITPFDETLRLLQGTWESVKNIDENGIERKFLNVKFHGDKKFSKTGYNMKNTLIIKGNYIKNVQDITEAIDFPGIIIESNMVYLPNSRKIIKIPKNRKECEEGYSTFNIHKINENELQIFSVMYLENKEKVRYLIEIYRKVN